MNESPSSSSAAQKQGPGARLQAARKAQRLSLQDVSQKLRLSSERINAIEADDYSLFQSATFARGYLRSYARLLSVEEQELLALFDELNLAATITSNPPKLFEYKEYSIKSRSFRWLSILIILVLLGLVAIWWHGRFNNTEKTTTTSSSPTEETSISKKSAPLPDVSASAKSSNSTDADNSESTNDTIPSAASKNKPKNSNTGEQ